MEGGMVQGEQSSCVGKEDNEGGGGKQERRSATLKLSREQERQAFQFIEEHEELYSKGHPEFLQTRHKLELWQQLADNLQTTDSNGIIANGPRLMTWWNTQRSAYGKLTRSVPGKRGKRLTPREKRLKERLAFLSEHVFRVHKRAGVDLMDQLRSKYPERFEAAPTVADHQPPAWPECEQTEHPPSTITSPSKKRKMSNGHLDDIQSRLDSNQHQLNQLIYREENERSAFGRLVGFSAQEMDDEAFDGFQMDVTVLLIKYKQETRARASAAIIASESALRLPTQTQIPSGTTINTQLPSSVTTIQPSQHIGSTWQRHCPRSVTDTQTSSDDIHVIKLELD